MLNSGRVGLGPIVMCPPASLSSQHPPPTPPPHPVVNRVALRLYLQTHCPANATRRHTHSYYHDYRRHQTHTHIHTHTHTHKPQRMCVFVFLLSNSARVYKGRPCGYTLQVYHCSSNILFVANLQNLELWNIVFDSSYLAFLASLLLSASPYTSTVANSIPTEMTRW